MIIDAGYRRSAEMPMYYRNDLGDWYKAEPLVKIDTRPYYRKLEKKRKKR